MYYNKQGKKIEPLEWAELLKDDKYKRVGLDQIGKYRISTVWLGLNHSNIDKKLIFETAVFVGEDIKDMDRYETLEEAVEEHKEFVKRYKLKK